MNIKNQSNDFNSVGLFSPQLSSNNYPGVSASPISTFSLLPSSPSFPLLQAPPFHSPELSQSTASHISKPNEKSLPNKKESKNILSTLTNEISLLLSLHHPHIIRLFGISETSSYMTVVMEYAARGSLSDLLYVFILLLFIIIIIILFFCSPLLS
jgi:hypothetical protein